MATLNVDIPPDKGRIEHILDPGSNAKNFYFNPEEIHFRSTASWVEHRIAGVHDPRLQYAGGEGTTIDFRLHLIRDVGKDAEPLNVDSDIRWFESLVFPAIDVQSVRHREPPRVRLMLGRGRGTYTCVVTEVDVIHRVFYSDLRTRYAELELKLIVDRVEARGWEFVRSSPGTGAAPPRIAEPQARRSALALNGGITEE